MTGFVIQTKRGAVSLPVKIGNFQFPLSFVDVNDATKFPFESAAERMIKKYKLNTFKYQAEIEAVEFE